MPRPATDKRDRLIDAAIECFHARGYAGTSIADVARKAKVAPGNVFYYFRAKDDLLGAVIERWKEMITSYAEDFGEGADPWRRIELFIGQAGVLRGMYISLGCPLAGITRDTRRDAPDLAEAASEIYDVQYRWLERQFCAAGFCDENARRHARFLMATYHGAIGLAYTQDDDMFITDAVEELRGWLNDIRMRIAA